jgi:hypothetical protein
MKRGLALSENPESHNKPASRNEPTIQVTPASQSSRRSSSNRRPDSSHLAPPSNKLPMTTVRRQSGTVTPRPSPTAGSSRRAGSATTSRRSDYKSAVRRESAVSITTTPRASEPNSCQPVRSTSAHPRDPLTLEICLHRTVTHTNRVHRVSRSHAQDPVMETKDKATQKARLNLQSKLLPSGHQMNPQQ